MNVIIRHAEKHHLYPNLSPESLEQIRHRLTVARATIRGASSLCDRTNYVWMWGCVCVFVRGVPGGRFRVAASGGQGGATRTTAAALTLWTPAGGLTRGPDGCDKHTSHTHKHTVHIHTQSHVYAYITEQHTHTTVSSAVDLNIKQLRHCLPLSIYILIKTGCNVRHGNCVELAHNAEKFLINILCQ